MSVVLLHSSINMSIFLQLCLMILLTLFSAALVSVRYVSMYLMLEVWSFVKVEANGLCGGSGVRSLMFYLVCDIWCISVLARLLCVSMSLSNLVYISLLFQIHDFKNASSLNLFVIPAFRLLRESL